MPYNVAHGGITWNDYPVIVQGLCKFINMLLQYVKFKLGRLTSRPCHSLRVMSVR
jgi:hypothetical protein